MSYEIRQFTQIDNKNIKLGKTFKYGENYNLTNIYYLDNCMNGGLNSSIPKEFEGRKQDSTDDKTKLIIQTPLLYIPNSIVYFNEKPFLELSFNNEENDTDVSKFREWIIRLEELIYKLVKRRITLKLDKSNMVSILKAGYRTSSSKLLVPINMNISKCILSVDDKKNKFLFNWEIPVPTYGISIIWVKNIWVKNGKWGINIFMYASRVMNSHILDPIDFMGETLDNKHIKPFDVIKKFAHDEKMKITIGNIPEYQMFFRMLKMGIPKDAIKQKMALNNIDIRIIDYPDTTPFTTVLHYLSNPQLPPYLKISNTSNNCITYPPPPPILPLQSPLQSPLQILLNKTNIGINNTTPNVMSGILNAINSGEFKLKKPDTTINSNIKLLEKINNQGNPNKLKVPSLNDIQSALARLRKIDMDISDINNK